VSDTLLGAALRSGSAWIRNLKPHSESQVRPGGENFEIPARARAAEMPSFEAPLGLSSLGVPFDA